MHNSDVSVIGAPQQRANVQAFFACAPKGARTSFKAVS